MVLGYHAACQHRPVRGQPSARAAHPPRAPRGAESGATRTGAGGARGAGRDLRRVLLVLGAAVPHGELVAGRHALPKRPARHGEALLAARVRSTYRQTWNVS